MTGWRKYKSRTEELAEARDAGKRRFKDYFSNVSHTDKNISDKAILKANLLYCSYQQFMADEEKDSEASLSLKAIVDVLNHVRDESILAETTADGQLKIVDLFNQNLAVRRNIMLFKGVCPDALKAIIMRYELDKCESRAGADKAVLIARFRNYLFHRVEPKASLCENFQYYQTDSYGQKIKVKNSVDYLKSWAVAFTPAELKTLKQGRTGRFLEHFCGDNQELFSEVTGHALSVESSSLSATSNSNLSVELMNQLNLLWNSFQPSFIQKLGLDVENGVQIFLRNFTTISMMNRYVHIFSV